MLLPYIRWLKPTGSLSASINCCMVALFCHNYITNYEYNWNVNLFSLFCNSVNWSEIRLRNSTQLVCHKEVSKHVTMQKKKKIRWNYVLLQRIVVRFEFQHFYFVFCILYYDNERSKQIVVLYKKNVQFHEFSMLFCSKHSTECGIYIFISNQKGKFETES